MKYKLLRFSLLCILAMLCGGSMWADVTKWVKTDPTSLTTGDVVVIVDQTSGCALEANGSSAPKATSVSLNSDKSEITSGVIDAMQLTVAIGTTKVNEVDTRSYQFSFGTDYLYCTTSNNGVRVGSNDNNNFIWVSDADNSNSTEPFLINTATSRYLGVYYNNNNPQDWRCYTSINNNIKATVTALYKKVVEVSADAPAAPTFSPAAGTYQTSQEVSISCETEGATIYYSTDGENFSAYTGAINVSETTTLYAYSKLGDDQSETVSAKYIILTTYTSLQALQEAATSISTPVAITFNNVQVVYVNGSNAFLADANGYGALIFTSGHGLEAGQVLNGTINCELVIYQGNTEITKFSKEGLDITSATVTPLEKTLPLTSANQSTLVTLKGLTYSSTDKTLSDGTNTIKFYDKFKTKIALEDGKTYDVTGIVVMFNDDIEICPRTVEDIVEAVEEPAEFQDFEITNEQMSGAFDASTLPACATFSGTQRNDNHGYGNVTLTVAVNGPVKFTFGGCQYANTTFTVKNEAGETLETLNTHTENCYHQDKSVITYLYKGEATTLTFATIQYLPYFKAETYQEPAAFEDFEITNEQMSGAFDASTLPACATFSGTQRNDNHGYGNVTLTVAVNGPVKFTFGGCQYANRTFTVKNEAGVTLETLNTYTANCYHQDKSVITYEYKGEATTLTFATIQYLPYFKAEAFEPEPEPAVQDVTATWDFTADPAKLNGSSANLTSIESNVDGISLSLSGGTTRDNSNSYQFQSGVTIQIPVKSTKDVITVIGYPGYTFYTIGSDEGTGNSPDVIHKVTAAEANQQYAVLTAGDNCYIKSITVLQKAETSPATLDNEEATATFPFNLGTEGQKATFTNADYWLSSKVVLGSNMGYASTRTLDNVTFSKIQPQTNTAAADKEDYVLFRIDPKPGFTFTPTAVSLNAYKDGTDNGKLTIKWVTADGTETELAKDVDIQRNNADPAFSSLEYNDLSGVTPLEGYCGLKVYIGGKLATNKQVGLSNIVIEGTLNGTEKEVPVLASFKINDKEYAVEDVFGDEYEATVELSKSETMVSTENPLSDVTATNGEIGEITYAGDATACVVTIPVSAGETTLSYVLNVTQKPDFTLTYFNINGEEIGTQTLEKDATIGEFKYNIADVAASQEGYKARGWFKQNYVGAKYKTTDVVTGNLNLYAVETEIEVSSDFKKYEFDLTDSNFDANDHEAFNPTGTGYWHDKQHGWAFANGDKIDLLVGAKANIFITLCQYSANGSTITMGETSVSAVSESDGGLTTIEYEGEPGTATLNINSTGAVYIHSIKIVNTTTTNYTEDGQWIIVKPGDASSFSDAIDAVNGNSGTEPIFIFLPNGTYDLAQKTKTQIGRDNVSIIGESMEGVIIKNTPATEGIDATATLLNTSSNLYMQDLTIECDAPWISSAERGVTLQDKGNQTILKNVYLKGKQDTYYSNNPSGTFYFEDGKIQGSVDYVCGHGDVYFNKTSFYTINKSTGGIGGCIAAPNTLKSFGYIFNNCTLDGQENEDGKYRLARPWAANTKCLFVNTTMKIKPFDAGWGEWSPKNAVAQYAEYNSVDADGNAIDLSGRATTIGDQPNNPVLTEAEAAALAVDQIFAGDWKPQVIAQQVAAPKAELKDGVISWTPANDGATAYAIFKDGEFLGITTGTTWTVEEVAGAPRRADEEAQTTGYTIRAANSRGGFGKPAEVSPATGISAIETELSGDVKIYDLNGRRVLTPTTGVYIINGKKVVIK